MNTDTIKAMLNAADEYRRDARFHALADSVVAHVFSEFGPINPDDPDRDAHEVATRVAALMLSRIYTEDAELNALRAERDRYKKLAEEGLMLRPLQVVIPAA